jgi:hypothetical protein
MSQREDHILEHPAFLPALPLHVLVLSSGAPFFHGVSSFSGGVFLPQDSGAVSRPLEMRWIRLTLRVQPLHLIEFLGRDLRQVPDEQNQAPGLRDGVRSAEGWHAAQTNSIFNCVVELAIALVLRPGCAQVGRFRIEALAEYRVAPPPSSEWHGEQW